MPETQKKPDSYDIKTLADGEEAQGLGSGGSLHK